MRLWWLASLIGIEPPGWPQRRARLAIVRLAWETSVVSTVTLAVLVVVEGLLSVGMQVATGAVVGSVPGAVQSGFASPAGRRLQTAVVAMGVVFLLGNVVPAVREQLAQWLGRRVDNALRLRLMDSMLAPVGTGHVEDPEIQDEVARAGSIQMFTPGGVVQGLAGLAEIRVTSLGSVVVVATFNWWLAIVLLLVALADEKRARHHYMEEARIVYRQTQDLRRSDYFRSIALGGAPKELRLFGMLDWVLGRFTGHWLDTMREVWRERSVATFYVAWTAPLMLVANAGALALVGMAAAQDEIGIGRLATLSAAIWGVRAFISYGLDRTRTEYGSTAYLPLLDLDDKVASHDQGARGSRAPEDGPRSSIRFDGVAFTYPGRDTPVFEHLDLEIRAGVSTAIVGANGAGKTTLCKLLARCYEPSDGRITVDGVDLRELDGHAWQRRVAAIFQDYVRFPVSLRDNVGFGAIEHLDDDAALQRAMARAGVEAFAGDLPKGTETILSKVFTDGTELSGGELQRVALARALFAVQGGAALLLLDEPSASLDVRTEARLFDRYLDLTQGVTTVLISHRFSTVRHADHICVLHSGRVAEQGTHDSLLADGGLYAEMFSLQASLYEQEADA